MKKINRLNLLEELGRELQARMTFREIDIYLRAFGIDLTKKAAPTGSGKRVYVKEVLADEAQETVLAIADDLGIEHGHARGGDLDLTDSRFWLPGHFKLFLSHVSSFKQKTAQLQCALRQYGISGFVAHEDIEPTKEWQEEIEKALFSMDALAAVLTPGFADSKWTDQEVGVAIGRDVLVIPVKRGLDPYGFIAKYQGFQAEGKSVREAAEGVFQIASTHGKTRTAMAAGLVNLLLFAKTEGDIDHWLGLLEGVGSLPTRELERLSENIASSGLVTQSAMLLARINAILRKHELPELQLGQGADIPPFDDVPF